MTTISVGDETLLVIQTDRAEVDVSNELAELTFIGGDQLEVLVTNKRETVEMGGSDASFIEVRLSATEVDVITAGIQGPVGAQGPPGTDEEVPYAKINDWVGDNLVYRGEAVPGTLTTSASWRIRRITFLPDGDSITDWADGNANFDNIWDNRASLSYS